MEESYRLTMETEEIHQQNMQLIVVNRRPQYPEQSEKARQKEMEKQLFRIFCKYV